MKTLSRRTRKCCSLAHPETLEDEDGGQGQAVIVPASASEALAQAKPPLEDRLNQEPICDQTQKAPVYKGRLPPPRQDRPTSNNTALE